MRAPDHHGVAVLQRHLGKQQRQPSCLSEDEIQGFPELQSPCRVEDIRARQAEVEVAGDVAGVFGYVGHEGYHIVLCLPLYLVDAPDGEVGLLGQFLRLFGRDLPELRPRPADRELHLEPGAVLGLLGPDRPDLGQGVAFDQAYPSNLSASSGSESARIWAASTPALAAPLTATVATGTPEGIWTVERRASKPFRVPEATGIPITGRLVRAATAPAR